jgi:hypothetical protein
MYMCLVRCTLRGFNKNCIYTSHNHACYILCRIIALYIIHYIDMMYLNVSIVIQVFKLVPFTKLYINKAVKFLDVCLSVSECSLTLHVRLLSRFAGIPRGNPLLFLAQLAIHK